MRISQEEKQYSEELVYLALCDAKAPLSRNELQERTGLTRTRTYQILQNLELKGWVENLNVKIGRGRPRSFWAVNTWEEWDSN